LKESGKGALPRRAHAQHAALREVRALSQDAGDWLPVSGTRFAEKISLVSMYNRVLTDNEVLQNYYAMKTRFGR
jgi:hypothetical protein